MALRKLDIYNPSGHIFELDYLSDSIFRGNSRGNSSRPFTIRIFGGGDSNIQTIQLKAAIQELNIDQKFYTIEILTADDVNVNHFSIKYIVDWLRDGSVHFITGHVHQGLQLAILDSNSSSSSSCFNQKCDYERAPTIKVSSRFSTRKFSSMSCISTRQI